MEEEKLLLLRKECDLSLSGEGFGTTEARDRAVPSDRIFWQIATALSHQLWLFELLIPVLGRERRKVKGLGHSWL